MELDITRKRSGVVSPSERLEVYRKWIDPGTVIILRSQLHPRQVATYHMVFPFIVGVRKNVGGKKVNTMVNVINMLKDKRKQLSQEYMTGFQLEEQKVDTILSAIDIQVLENGAMRGYLQDQWNEDAGCPAERPFVFMTIISNGDVFDCGFLKDKNGDLDHKRIWNGATISFHPNQFLSGDLSLSRLPGLHHVSLPQVRSLEIRPVDDEDIVDPYGDEGPDINSSEDEPLDSDNEREKAKESDPTQAIDEGYPNLGNVTQFMWMRKNLL